MLSSFEVIEEDCEEFDKLENYNAEGATAHPSADELDECMSTCEDNQGCMAFDFDVTKNPWMNVRCWLFLGDTELTVKPQSDVNHYTKNNKCGAGRSNVGQRVVQCRSNNMVQRKSDRCPM